MPDATGQPDGTGQGRKTLLVVGGTAGIGLEIARRGVARGDEVIIAGRDATRAQTVAKELGETARGAGVDLSHPEGIADGLAGISHVDHVVLTAIQRDENTVANYDLARAISLTTLKLVGYTEVIHVLLPAMTADSSIVVFGGLAKDRPYPGSTTVSTVNGGVTGMIRTMAIELAPIRINALHPGIIGDSPYWAGKPAGVLEGYRSATPTGRLATVAEIADSVEFLLRNASVNGMNLNVDGGWTLT